MGLFNSEIPTMSQLIFCRDKPHAKQLSRLAKNNQIRRIYHGVYTDNLHDPLTTIIQRYWMQIVAHIVPAGILGFRTAIDLKPVLYRDTSIVFVVASYTKTVRYTGLTIKILKGNNQCYFEQVLPNLARSNVARSLLENLTSIRRAAYRGVKTIGEQGVEDYLVNIMRVQEEHLNQIRDQAKKIAEVLGYQSEYKKLNQLISALLSTRSQQVLKNARTKVLVKKQPYDANRLDLFYQYYYYLKRCQFQQRQYTFSTLSFRNISFFESYFSNFIEGTEFIIDEAEDIVFLNKKIIHRHADSHDVLSHFYLANDFFEMSKTPTTAQALIEILKSRHHFLMKERPEKNPGEFKTRANKAGNTYFVEPKEVVGTLIQGFDIYQWLAPGMPRALFMQFLISEIHPFEDGNGRLARVMMNAELVQAGFFKMIIPTVQLENYLNGLRRASRDHYFQTFCKVLDQAQAYVQSISWDDYTQVREKIEQDQADKTPDEGLPAFNRVLRQFSLSYLPI